MAIPALLPMIMSLIQSGKDQSDKAVSGATQASGRIQTPANSFAGNTTGHEIPHAASAAPTAAPTAQGGGSGKQFGMNMLQSGISSLMQSSQNAMQNYGKNTVQLPQHRGFGTMSRQSRGF